METKIVKSKTGVVTGDKLSHCCFFPIGEMTITYKDGTTRHTTECTCCKKTSPTPSTLLERN